LRASWAPAISAKPRRPGIAPSPKVIAMGVWVECVHAATALALAGSDPFRSRAELADAGVATAWAGLGYSDLRRRRAAAPARPP
jgi:hypothetical protein